MPIAARRVFRLSLTVALALAAGYALAMPLPFIAPLFAFMLGAKPGPPMGFKGLVGVVLVVLLTLGTGLVLIPMLLTYPLTAILVVSLGLYLSNYLTVIQGKELVGALLTVGFTMISAAGLVDYGLAVLIVKDLVMGIAISVFCQWLVYPLFPEDPATPQPPAPPVAGAERSNWIALRATLIVLPAYLLLLTNPLAYMPVIMKSVSLGQQASIMGAREAGRELLGSTFLAGCFAVLFWFLLKLNPNLWMFFLWMLLFGIYFAAKLYGVSPSRYPGSFWVNTAVTMLILIGPAVQDSANGKDVYAAFAVRMGLFIAVTLYAWLAIQLLEHLRARRLEKRRGAAATEPEITPC